MDIEQANVPTDLNTWVKRYLKGRDLKKMQYEPYLYPTLPPWEKEKYEEVESILRFYNHSILNYDESININTDLFEAIANHCREKNIRLVLFELTLHNKIKEGREE